MTPRVFISCGDVNGIGLRCLAAALDHAPELAPYITLVIDRSVLDQAQLTYGIHLPVDVHSIYSPCGITPGKPSVDASRLAISSLETAFTLAAQQPMTGVTTLPINKLALRSVGWKYDGQTEMAADYDRRSTPLMVLCHESVRVALATVHIPISAVPASLTVPSIVSKLTTLHRHLVDDIGIASPRIAVLGLNPHASEGGEIGDEDQTIVHPAVHAAIQLGIHTEGPFPADGFFGFGAYRQFDGVLAMYHDQGLIPVKLLSKGAGVNVTAGLTIVRTSPDHGTAYDILPHQDVDWQSTHHAIALCASIVSQRGVMGTAS